MLDKVIKLNRLQELKKNNNSEDCQQNLHCMWRKQLKRKRQDLVQKWVEDKNVNLGTSALASNINRQSGLFLLGS